MIATLLLDIGQHPGAVERDATLTVMSRTFTTSFSSVYPLYLTKMERKGRTKAELDQVIEWLTGFDESTLGEHLAAGTTFEGLFNRVGKVPESLPTTRARRSMSSSQHDAFSASARPYFFNLMWGS